MARKRAWGGCDRQKTTSFSGAWREITVRTLRLTRDSQLIALAMVEHPTPGSNEARPLLTRPLFTRSIRTERRIRDALTGDHHLVQAGFRSLLLPLPGSQRCNVIDLCKKIEPTVV